MENNFGNSTLHTSPTPSNERIYRMKNGQCPDCGNQTHTIKRNFFQRKKKITLTIKEQVVNGRCLFCHPIIHNVAQAYIVNNAFLVPESLVNDISAPAPPPLMLTNQDDNNVINDTIAGVAEISIEVAALAPSASLQHSNRKNVVKEYSNEKYEKKVNDFESKVATMNSSSLTTIDHFKDCACNSDCQFLLECPMCLCICHDAVETECCGNIFCDECIQQWCDQDNINQIAPCPMCNTHPFKVHPATRLRRIIECEMKKNCVLETNHGIGMPDQNRTDEAVTNEDNNNVINDVIAGVAKISVGIAALAPSETNQQSDQKHTVKDYSNGKYEGEVNSSGKRDGWGKMTYINGGVYKGQWKDDMCEGKGVYRCPGGEVYDGYWKDGKREGKGVYRWANGRAYEGDFKNGLFEGKGVQLWPNGEVYEGDFKNGIWDGKGVHRWPDGQVYDGDWKYGQREGKGIQRWPDGRVYDGYWFNNKPNK